MMASFSEKGCVFHKTKCLSLKGSPRLLRFSPRSRFPPHTHQQAPVKPVVEQTVFLNFGSPLSDSTSVHVPGCLGSERVDSYLCSGRNRSNLDSEIPPRRQTTSVGKKL